MKKYLLIIFQLFALIMSLPAFAQESKKAEPIIFFVKEMQPFGFIKDGKAMGAGVDAAYAIAKEIHQPAIIKVVPHARLVQNFKYKDDDSKQVFNMDFTFNIDSQNIVNSIPIIPFYKFEVLLVGRKDLDLSDVSKIRDIKIAIIRGARYTSALNKKANNIQMVEVSDYQQALQLFTLGRVDAVIGTQFPIILAAKKLGAGFEILDNFAVIDHTRLWIYASSTSKHLYSIPAIKAAVNKLIEDGSIQRIVEKYSNIL